MSNNKKQKEEEVIWSDDDSGPEEYTSDSESEIQKKRHPFFTDEAKGCVTWQDWKKAVKQMKKEEEDENKERDKKIAIPTENGDHHRDARENSKKSCYITYEEMDEEIYKLKKEMGMKMPLKSTRQFIKECCSKNIYELSIKECCSNIYYDHGVCGWFEYENRTWFYRKQQKTEKALKNDLKELETQYVLPRPIYILKHLSDHHPNQ